LDFPKYVKCCQGCVFKQLLSNNTIRSEASSQLFYSLSILLFFENSSSKASGLLFIFVCVSTGYAHFSNDEICISCEPDRPTSVFFSCETAVNMVRKSGLKSVESCSARFSTEKRNPPLSKSLPVCK